MTPTEVRHRRAERALELTWPDGVRHGLPAEFLRVHSPSAEVKGHGPGQEVLVHGRRHVGILRLEPVGNYALRILFDDTHDTGIYPWDTLRRLGDEQAERWRFYEAALAARGLSRDPPPRRGTATPPPAEWAPDPGAGPPRPDARPETGPGTGPGSGTGHHR